MITQTDGIWLVKPSETLDDRWKTFSKEEITAIIDGLFNYESGEVSNETVKSLVASLLAEAKSRE